MWYTRSDLNPRSSESEMLSYRIGAPLSPKKKQRKNTKGTANQHKSGQKKKTHPRTPPGVSAWRHLPSLSLKPKVDIAGSGSMQRYSGFLASPVMLCDPGHVACFFPFGSLCSGFVGTEGRNGEEHPYGRGISGSGK